MTKPGAKAEPKKAVPAAPSCALTRQSQLRSTLLTPAAKNQKRWRLRH